MKKTLLVLLSLAALAAFVGCSNSAGSSGSSGNSSSGGPDLSGVTDTSASWTITRGWYKYEKPYEFTTTSQSGSPWEDGTKFSLSNPGSKTITRIIGYEGRDLTYKGSRDVNFTITNQTAEIGAFGAIAWIETDGSISIALCDEWKTSNTKNANNRFVIIFSNNTKLDVFGWN